MTGLTWLIALRVMFLPLPCPADAQEPSLRGLQHVRGMNARAREILESARALSPTVARLMVELQDTDVIVNIITGWLPGRADGVAYIVAATPSVRYVRVVLRLPNTDRCLMAVLGHELQHAVEIARMPGVRDARSLGAVYRQIGVAMADNTNFETAAAVRAGKQVALEVRRAVEQVALDVRRGQ